MANKNLAVLLYNLDNEKGKAIKKLCIKNGIKIKIVEKELYTKTIGSLAKIKGFEDKTILDDSDIDITEEMMIMKGFSSNDIDMFLKGFHKDKIQKIELKAIITPSNSDWNSYQLYKELKKERSSYT